MIQTLTRSSRPIAMRVKKENNYKRHSGAPEKYLKEDQVSTFARLIHSICKDGRLIDRAQIARVVQRVVGKDVDITYRMASAWISRARDYMLRELGCTFIYVGARESYKIAEGKEKILQVAKTGHMAVKWKNRFLLTATILTPEEMKMAHCESILRLKKDAETSNLLDQRFLDGYKQNMKELSMEIKDAQKTQNSSK